MAKQYHIDIDESQAGEYAILTGDPGRVEYLVKYLDGGHVVGSNREYTTGLGTVNGLKVNIMSVGIGGPSMAIGVEELYKLGCKNFIRVGTCGGINLNVKAGDLIVANAAVRQEGTGNEYFPTIYPAVSDFSVTSAIVEAIKNSTPKNDFHVGVVQSKDSFYGQHAPERMPIKEHLLDLWEVYRRSGVLASEMECAALFLTAASLKARAGAILLAIWNDDRKKEFGDMSECHDTEKMYKIAVESVKNLILNKI